MKHRVLSHSVIPLVVISLLLAASSLFHFFKPEVAFVFLGDSTNIRIVGVVLVVLGVAAIANKSLYSKVVGGLVLLSGLGRAINPEQLIVINEWTDKSTHGVLLGLGALLVLVAACRVVTLREVAESIS